ncbi:MAG: hypothetical protein HQK54_09015 [Oligoflexales bacterium]|nr:hypothetical protein [Oligoflexales bacterium]
MNHVSIETCILFIFLAVMNSITAGCEKTDPGAKGAKTEYKSKSIQSYEKIGSSVEILSDLDEKAENPEDNPSIYNDRTNAVEADALLFSSETVSSGKSGDRPSTDSFPTLNLDPICIWPPNSKMVRIDFNDYIKIKNDNCKIDVKVEEIVTEKNGNVKVAVIDTRQNTKIDLKNLSVSYKAERGSDAKEGRNYQTLISCLNQSPISVSIIVPFDAGNSRSGCKIKASGN